jgi:hypothetical protein
LDARELRADVEQTIDWQIGNVAAFRTNSLVAAVVSELRLNTAGSCGCYGWVFKRALNTPKPDISY